MPKQSTSPSKGDRTEATTPMAVPDPEKHEHVPETAENFEHTLRRLIRERDKDRAQKAGLYR